MSLCDVTKEHGDRNLVPHIIVVYGYTYSPPREILTLLYMAEALGEDVRLNFRTRLRSCEGTLDINSNYRNRHPAPNILKYFYIHALWMSSFESSLICHSRQQVRQNLEPTYIYSPRRSTLLRLTRKIAETSSHQENIKNVKTYVAHASLSFAIRAFSCALARATRKQTRYWF